MAHVASLTACLLETSWKRWQLFILWTESPRGRAFYGLGAGWYVLVGSLLPDNLSWAKFTPRETQPFQNSCLTSPAGTMLWIGAFLSCSGNNWGNGERWLGMVPLFKRKLQVITGKNAKTLLHWAAVVESQRFPSSSGIWDWVPRSHSLGLKEFHFFFCGCEEQVDVGKDRAVTDGDSKSRWGGACQPA